MIAESIAAIKKRLTATLQANTALYDPANPDVTKRGLTSPSQVAAWNNFLGVIAAEIQLNQALMQVFEAEVEAFIALAPPSIGPWIKNQVLQFQYDAVNPQVLQLDAVSFIASYPVIDLTKLIISQCSVVTSANRTVLIKVATGSPAAALSVAQQAALAGYCDLKFGAGLKTSIVSLAPDQISVTATIYYNGQYSAVISATVIAAINAFLTAIPFNGVFLLSSLEKAILAVPGVNDVAFVQVTARPNTVVFANATKLVDNSQELIRNWNTVAGYVISEATAAHTLADTLTFTVG